MFQVGAMVAPAHQYPLGVRHHGRDRGGLIGLAVIIALYPDAARAADQTVVPHRQPKAS
jgi:hypothetical protein